MDATLLALAPAEAAREFERLGGRRFHAAIARREVLERGTADYAAMTGLPQALRERLAAELPIFSTRELAQKRAADGTVKLLLGLAPRPGRSSDRVDGREDTIETVHLPSSTPGQAATLCVSSQVGCPVGCPFCASGKLGLVRNLEAHEIVEQYARGRALGPLARSVVMGIGEPLLNFAALRAALDVVHDEMGLGSRRVTVSTVGFPERVRAAASSKPRFELAISLHTPFDAERDVLVPAMKGVPIDEVLAAADFWFETTRREVTYEYALLAGTNDSREHAEKLAERLARRRATVNLIPYNPLGGNPLGGNPLGGHLSGGDPLRDAPSAQNPLASGEFGRPTREAAERFRRALADRGIVATVRWSKGVDADAACGQLRLRAAVAPEP